MAAAMGPPPSPEVQAAMRDADWQDRKRLNELLITATVLTGMSVVVVSLRSVSRFILIRNPRTDDFLMLGALACTIGYLVALFDAGNSHIGFPAYMLSLEDVTKILKGALSVEVVYYAIIFCIKASILFTYLRFAVSETFRKLCLATIVLHAVFFAVCLIVTLTQCRPLEKMWDLLGVVNGSCINTTAFFYSTSGFNIVTDIWILVLPAKTLSSVHRPRREKILLFTVFGVGAFAAAASVVRLHTIYRYTLAADPSLDALAVNLWSMIEVNVAMCCASASALKPVFSRVRRRGSPQAPAASQGRSGGGAAGPRSSRAGWGLRLSSNNDSVAGGPAGADVEEMAGAEKQGASFQGLASVTAAPGGSEGTLTSQGTTTVMSSPTMSGREGYKEGICSR